MNRTERDRVWAAAFQIRKVFVDHYGAVPDELLRFADERLKEISDLLKPKLLTEDDIVNRADARAARPSWIYRTGFFSLLVLTVILLNVPWMRVRLIAHREFVLGVLVGSVLELGIVFGSRWAWDGVLWMKWFSHQ
jgi:hypothetical protein